MCIRDRNDYIALFSTGSDVDTGRPSITGFNPGNGASGVAVNSNIILYSNEPINESTLSNEGAFFVSQNGQLISGSLSLSGGGQVITFTPDNLFVEGSLIEVFANSQVEDVSGNALNGYQASFRVEVDTSLQAPTVTAMTPRDDLPLNAVLGLRFSEAIDPASITADNIRLSETFSSEALSTQLILDEDGRTLWIVPDNLLNDSVSFHRLVVSVTDLDGESYSSSWFYNLATDAVEDTVMPAVSLLVPESGRQNVGINARIVGTFDEAINPLTLDRTTIVPDRTGSLSIASDNQSFTFTPHNPLASSSEVTAMVSGVEDLAGNTIIESSTTFTTLNGLDQARPEVLAQSPVNGMDNVATTAVVSVEFDEVIDVSYISDTRIRLFDNSLRSNVSAQIARSEDGRTVSLVPDEELAVGRSYTAFYDVRDYAGNLNRFISFSFTTSFVPDGESPLVENFSVLDGLDNVPTNALLQVEFSEAVNVLRLGDIKLYQGGEEVILQSRTLSSNREVVTLSLAQLLEPSSSYTIEVAGVEDLAGNVLTTPVISTFETGSGTDLVNPTRVEFTPLSRSTISTDGNLAIRYSERLTPLTVSGQVGSIGLTNNSTRQDEPVSAVLSADGRTVEFIATEGLQPNSSYTLFEDEFRDLANNRVNGGSPSFHTFFTGTE